MGTYYKGGITTYHTVSDNIPSTADKYEYSNGYFGDKGQAKVKNNYYRQVVCKDQYAEAKNFYDSIAHGGVEQQLPNGKGYITKLKDGTIITYRELTSTKGSPAIEINIKNTQNSGGVKSQKIHFEKESK